MELKGYISQKKRIYLSFLTFLENSNEDDDNNFQNLISIVQSQKCVENKEEFHHFLRLLVNFADNYHRDVELFEKITKILSFFSNEIKRTFSNIELFDIFSTNKLILLYLIDKTIITLNNAIFNCIYKKYDKNGSRYCHFFIPEIKKFINSKLIEDELIKSDPDIFTNYDEKRRLGVNDSYICSLIRDDLIEEFVSYVTQSNFQLSSNVPHSIFETNEYLIENDPTIIEYAAFYGSIKIFQYLKFNEVEITPTVWKFAIHSKSAEMIHLLETNCIEMDNKNELYKSCLFESIKCNHNDFASYIQNNLFAKENINISVLKEQVIDCALHYCNYCYLPNDYDDCEFFYFCFYGYFNAVNCIINMKKDDFDKNRIFKNCISYNSQL